jgi:hypothetical protein
MSPQARKTATAGDTFVVIRLARSVSHLLR